jgi:hypothetical protein
MPNIDKNQFNRALAGGVNLRDAKLAEKLAVAGVPLTDVAKADLDKDGVLNSPAELAQAFRMVDAFDRNGSGNSFAQAGKAGAVYDAFVGAVLPPRGKFADKIISAGLDRAARHGPSYAKEQAPVSPNPQLTANRKPGTTVLTWLKDQWKCNQFVGDSLTQAGVKAPLFKMADGSYHYAPAEKWPGFHNLFDRITDTSKLQVGDVLIKDYPSRGDATAHVEIVTSVSPFKSVGAHYDGAYEVEGASWLEGGTYNASKRAFDVGGNTVYILRPKAAR